MVVINNKEIIDIFKRLAAAIRYNEYAYLIYNDDFIDLLSEDGLIKLASEWLEEWNKMKLIIILQLGGNPIILLQ